MDVPEEERSWGPNGGERGGNPAREPGEGDEGSHGGRRRAAAAVQVTLVREVRGETLRRGEEDGCRGSREPRQDCTVGRLI